MKTQPTGVLDTLAPHAWSPEEIDRRWKAALRVIRRVYRKILVLDDDPTGSQTVYDIPVYTGFDADSLVEAWRDPSPVVYVLTNSRSLHPPESEALHRRLIRNWWSARERAGFPDAESLVISRSDSTLRGHYPLEPAVIREEWSRAGGGPLTEVLYPFFLEGGRYTLDNVHYVRDGEKLVPAGETEFARDSSFSYTASDLRKYVEEKTRGRISAERVRSIGVDIIRAGDVSGIAEIFSTSTPESPVVVNSVSYDDVKVLVAAFAEALASGIRFVFRSAASVVKVLAGLEERPLLHRRDLLGPISTTGPGPGLVVAGSYVGKTTRQLAALSEKGAVTKVKLDIREALFTDRFEAEVDRVRREVDELLSRGTNVALYTVNAGGREYLRADEGEEGLTDLQLSARISSGLVDIVAGLETAPSWMITKGGITSHDIAVRALGIRVAPVLGQIIPGVPVWRLGSESRWPGLPLVIFPGNVGDQGALARVVGTLIG